MIEQLVHETQQDLAILAVDPHGEADVAIGNQRDDVLETEDCTAVRDDLRAAIVPDTPAQCIRLKHRLGELEWWRRR